MKKVWLNSYEAGVAAEIDVNRYSSIVDVWQQSVEKYAQNPAFYNMGKELNHQCGQ